MHLFFDIFYFDYRQRNKALSFSRDSWTRNPGFRALDEMNLEQVIFDLGFVLLIAALMIGFCTIWANVAYRSEILHQHKLCNITIFKVILNSLQKKTMMVAPINHVVVHVGLVAP